MLIMSEVGLDMTQMIRNKFRKYCEQAPETCCIERQAEHTLEKLTHSRRVVQTNILHSKLALFFFPSSSVCSFLLFSTLRLYNINTSFCLYSLFYLKFCMHFRYIILFTLSSFLHFTPIKREKKY